MIESHTNYIDRKYSQSELRSEVVFNDVIRGTENIDGEDVEVVLSSTPIATVYFVLPVDLTDEQIGQKIAEYKARL